MEQWNVLLMALNGKLISNSLKWRIRGVFVQAEQGNLLRVNMLATREDTAKILDSSLIVRSAMHHLVVTCLFKGHFQFFTKRYQFFSTTL